MFFLWFLAVAGVVLAAVAFLLALMARGRARHVERALEAAEARLAGLEEAARRTEDALRVTSAVMVDHGVVSLEDLAAARERHVDAPRRIRAEREELLRDVGDRDHILERLVQSPSERKH